jgi:hypothetical protein
MSLKVGACAVLLFGKYYECTRSHTDRVTFLDVSTKVQDATTDRRYEGVSNLLLGAMFTAEGDDESCVLRHVRWAENRCSHKVAERVGRYKRIELA